MLKVDTLSSILFFAMFSLAIPFNLMGQMDLCQVPDSCTDIKVEMIRVYDNIAPTCTTSTDYDCSNRFHQMAYKVYLRYTIAAPGGTGPIGTIDLNYKQLDVTVKLIKGGSDLFSKINTKATEECFNASTNGTYWNGYSPPSGQTSNKPDFTAFEDKVVLTFYNGEGAPPVCGSTSSGGGNMITFDFDEQDPPRVDFCPQGKTCAFVELFTVVVDAYPSEDIRLNLEKATYVSNTSPTIDCNFTVFSSGSNQATSNIIIPNPGTYTSTTNERMELSFGNPAATSVSGQYEVPILLTNTGSQAVTVKYLEFLMNADVADLYTPFEYDVADDPEVFETLNAPGSNFYNVNRKLLYKINLSQTVSPGSGNAYTVAKIILGPTTIASAGWNVGLAFIDQSKARIKTTVSGGDVCTNLKFNDVSYQTGVYESGNQLCANYSIRYYSILLPKAGYCNEFELYIGLKSLEINPIKLAGFKVQLQINSPGVTFGNSVDFLTSTSPATPQAWPYDCSGLFSSCGSGCYTVSQSNTQFQYCFDVNSANDAVEFFKNDKINYFKIPVLIPDGKCLTDLSIESLSLKYFDNSVPYYCVPFPDETIGLPQCPNFGISGKLLTPEGEGLENATVTITPSGGANCIDPCDDELTATTGIPGAFGFCDLCLDCGKFTVKPTMELDPLNGVNTYDLVLISRHILGLEPLNEPYKLINADANKSGTITTFDVVELRKLILGTYTVLPSNSSWRFVDKDQEFANPQNPFAEVITEQIEILTIDLPNSSVDFVACKIGDVDYTAIPNNKNMGAASSIAWEVPVVNKENIITIPVYYTGAEPSVAVQFALNFDPGQMTFISTSGGNVSGLNDLNFGINETDNGRITFSWNAMDFQQTPVHPGEILFKVTFYVNAPGNFKQKTSLQLSESDERLKALSWSEYGLVSEIKHEVSNFVTMRDGNDKDEVKVIGTVIPNPAQNNTILQIKSPVSGKSHLVLMNAYGQRLVVKEVMVVEGITEIPLTEIMNFPAGVYQWSMQLPSSDSAAGEFIVR